MTTAALSASSFLLNVPPNWKEGWRENGALEAKREKYFKGEEVIGQVR